jgi:acetoin:2,6-dichlorophenolindophenol oxidoreductase subunit beta
VPDPSIEYTIPFGKADIKRNGTDLTIIATSSMAQVALDAAEGLAQEGIEAEVIDPQTLTPLDEATLISSVKKTSRCIVLDEGYQRFGATAEIAAVVAEKAFYYLDAPVRRIGAMDVPIPFSPLLEDQTIPSPAGVMKAAHNLKRR